MLDSESLDHYFLTLVSAGDYDGAVKFFKGQIRLALPAGDEEVAHACHLLIASLITAGPDQEALDLLRQVVKLRPENIYLSSSFAGFLLSLKQPAQALEVLEPVYELLVAEEESRHAALGLRGAILLELGRTQEAKECFREMIQPSLWRMYPGAVDFRLVESLVSKGLLREECERYLEIIYQRAQESNDQEVMNRSGKLLELLR